METTLFFLTSFLGSIVGSISGMGGGILIKPLLEMFSSHRVETVNFLSGCTVLSMSVVSLLRRKRSMQAFAYRRGTLLAVGSAAGGIAGKLLFDAGGSAFNTGALRALQPALLGLMVAALLVYLRNKEQVTSIHLKDGPACILLGGFLGLLSAFLGIGGGPLNLAALGFFFSMDNKSASLYSLYIILFSQTASLLLTFGRGTLPWFVPSQLACVILGGVLGALAGSRLAARMDNRQIGRLYGAVLVAVLLLCTHQVFVYLLP